MLGSGGLFTRPGSQTRLTWYSGTAALCGWYWTGPEVIGSTDLQALVLGGLGELLLMLGFGDDGGASGA